MPLLLTREEVARVLSMKDAIAAVEEGFRQLALGKVTMPQRTAIRIADHHGLHLAMPAHVGGKAGNGSEDDGGTEVLAVKVVTVYPDNPAKYHLPTTIGTLLLNDPRTGALLAIMDAGFLTGMRTGAVSGVATKYLARKDAHTVGIFGAGAMARMQLLAMAEVRPIERVVVCDPAVETRERFADEMSAKIGGAPVHAARAPEDCLACDIVVAASSSRTPLFNGALLRPGTHLNGIGAHSPEARELDTETMLRSKVVVDFLPACLKEAGELMLPISDGAYDESKVHASLGEVVAGIRTARESDREITLFKSVGLAVQDAATAARVYDRARAAGVGTEVKI